MSATSEGGRAAFAPGVPSVAPRVRTTDGGEVLPLTFHIERILAEGRGGRVNLVGGPGSGKSMALAHLAARFGDRLLLLDEVEAGDRETERPIVFATRKRSGGVLLELAGWREDDLIEYLLHRHREKCASVMKRLKASGRLLGGVPEVWAAVLEEFAADEQLTETAAALRRRAWRELGAAQRYLQVAKDLLRVILAQEKWPDLGHFADAPIRLLRHREVALLLAAEALASDLGAGRVADLERKMPRDLIGETAKLLRRRKAALTHLKRQVRQQPPAAPMAASLLLAVDEHWRPRGKVIPNLHGAYLGGAKWSRVNLKGCDLSEANLFSADLSQAVLAGAEASGTGLRQANLRGAHLDGFVGDLADLTSVDLSGADLREARFVQARLESVNAHLADFGNAILNRARLAGARLAGANLAGSFLHDTLVEDADFTDANLSGALLSNVCLRQACFRGACFASARMLNCDLETMELPAANFEGADLRGSYFTASVIARGNFRAAVLRSAGLAEVEWEEADLRDADFTGASFQMGSSRSGLVGSVIASEGSRTGFYTDDYNDQEFKAPEEIRKANLCRCDLRGAKVDGADFYLVDLRGALYDEEQGKHFARCGAILRERR